MEDFFHFGDYYFLNSNIFFVWPQKLKQYFKMACLLQITK